MAFFWYGIHLKQHDYEINRLLIPGFLETTLTLIFSHIAMWLPNYSMDGAPVKRFVLWSVFYFFFSTIIALHWATFQRVTTLVDAGPVSPTHTQNCSDILIVAIIVIQLFTIAYCLMENKRLLWLSTGTLRKFYGERTDNCSLYCNHYCILLLNKQYSERI